jgi:putative FmdB family regulatory protein
MATYEYLCLACEDAFEVTRSITSAVDVAVACPACGSDRIRRRFSVFATGSFDAGPATGGCACGGACACGGH